jgi:hypothetical protein
VRRGWETCDGGERQRRKKFQISDLRFQIEETAIATAVESGYAERGGPRFRSRYTGGRSKRGPYGKNQATRTRRDKILMSEGNG